MANPVPTHHLRPTAAIAPRALLPGDPGRALALAQELLEGPRMANHARGLWGYTASTSEGVELTVQSTGIGGPSVAVVLEELVALGVGSAIRIGTCRAVEPAFSAGDLVVALAAIPPGASRPYGRDGLEPDARLTGELENDPAVRGVTVAGTDLYYEPEVSVRREALRAQGAQVTDLGTVAMLEVGGRLGIAVASGLVVAESADGRRLSDEDVEAASLRLGRIASGALCA